MLRERFQTFEHTFILGRWGLIQLVITLCIALMIWVWQSAFSWLWGMIWQFFFVLICGVILFVVVRLAPPKNHYVGLVVTLKDKEFDWGEFATQILICVIAATLNFYLVAQIFGQSLFSGSLQVKFFVACNSTWEEMFFCMLQIFFMRFSYGTPGIWFGIGLRAFFFAAYHIMVYQNILSALVGMFFMGFIYGFALAYFKRVDVCMFTHFLLNCIAA